MEAYLKNNKIASSQAPRNDNIESKGNREQFGDFSSTVAFQLAPIVKKSPLEIAKEIVALIPLARNDSSSYIQKVEIAGNGFINFFLDEKIYRDSFREFSLKSLPIVMAGKESKVIIEFSSPNVAKPFHIGHLRNTVLGEFLSRLHEYTNHNVIRWNHLGDWGTQFGKLIVAYKKWGDEKKIDKNPITELLYLYVKFTNEAKKERESLAPLEKSRPEAAGAVPEAGRSLTGLEQQARDEFNKLEKGDAVNIELLKWFQKETIKEFSLLYKRLDSRFDVIKGESSYIAGKEKLFGLLSKKGFLEKSEGAKIVSLESEGMLPVLLEKSDGATLYHTRDLLSLQYRLEKYHPDRILYVVGDEQTLYLKQLFVVAKKIGLNAADLQHVSYGLVFGPGKKKLSTREGNVITANEIIKDVLFKASAVMHEKHPDAATRPPTKVTEDIALGAIKYNLLKESRQSDVVFDFDAMLSFQGNSGPYLQYTYARISKILSRAGIFASAKRDMLYGDRTDIAVMKKILEFSDVLDTCMQILSSHPLAEYLFSLANELNAFYEKNPILKDEDAKRRKQRLYMLRISADVLQQGLELLGIQAPKQI